MRWRERTPALHQDDAVDLPTSGDAPQEAFLPTHERQLPEEVGREDVARVKARIAALRSRDVERILRDCHRVASVELEDLTRIVYRMAVGVAETVVPLISEAPVVAHLQRVVGRADPVDALAYRARLDQAPVADRFVLGRRFIVNTSDWRGVGRQSIREAGEGERLLRICRRVEVGTAEAVDQISDERIGIDRLEELRALVADVTRLKNIVPE